jgi:acyl-CoA thioester hydrolase
VPSHRIEIELEVPFHDVDGLHVVWHGHYYKYFELARTELLRSCKLDVPDMIELGLRMVVIESKCRHIYPLRYGDKFRVSAYFKEVEYRLHIAFELFNLSAQRRAAKGHTMLATLDAEGNLLLATPASMITRLTHVTRSSHVVRS